MASAYVFANATKAGTRGSDQAKIRATIARMSKNSAHFAQARQADERTNVRVAHLREQIRSLKARGPDAEAVRLARFDALIASIEATRTLSRTWTVVDMDQFFAAVAMRDDPSLVGKPVAVGGDAMISTANYTARKFGVRSAMPGFIARELCPSLVFVRCDFESYKAAAAQMHVIFAEYDPDFRSMSLDEAALDITEIVASCDEQRAVLGAERDAAEVHGGRSPSDDSSPELSPLAVPPRAAPHPAEVVATIRRRIFDATQLTASAGVAPNKMLAKICSDENKPNGQVS